MLEAPYGSKTKHAQHPQPAQAQLSQLSLQFCKVHSFVSFFTLVALQRENLSNTLNLKKQIFRRALNSLFQQESRDPICTIRCIKASTWQQERPEPRIFSKESGNFVANIRLLLSFARSRNFEPITRICFHKRLNFEPSGISSFGTWGICTRRAGKLYKARSRRRRR